MSSEILIFNTHSLKYKDTTRNQDSEKKGDMCKSIYIGFGAYQEDLNKRKQP